MKWVLSHQSAEHHRWVLRHAEDGAQFTYHLFNHSIRIKAKTARLFFLEQTGFLHKKFLLLSEYGVVVAEAQAVARGRLGALLFDGHRQFYRFDGKEVLLFDKDKNLLAQQNVECRPDTEKMEEMAFVFMAAWMAFSTAGAKKGETVLVA